MSTAKPFPRCLYALLGVLTAVILLTGCPRDTSMATVPYLSGLLRSDAEAALTHAGLTPGQITTSYSEVIGAGRVLTQNPYPGISVAQGTAVALVISLGAVPADVPDVVGMAQADAEAALSAAGFGAAVTEVFSETVEAGYVAGQSPEGGESAPLGSDVQIEVSKGPDLLTVPDVAGMTQAAAESALTAERLVIGTVNEVWNDIVAAGLVISQSPVAETVVAGGTAVDLEVSKGPQPLTVPPLLGLTIQEAEVALGAAGLALGEVTEAEDDAAPDTVIGQNPPADEVVLPSTAVNVVVSLGSEEMQLHTAVWQDVVQKANSHKQFKYGIYASRSLMVAHPEVYLAADAVWMERLVTQYGGWQAEYGHRNRTGDADYWYNVGGPIYEALENETTLDGSEFDWDSFQWENHRNNAAPLSSLYDSRAPFRNWLDMRLPAVWNALKATGWQTPQLSLGEALYFQLREEHESVFLLITDAERAYAAVSTGISPVLYDPLTGNSISAGEMAGKAVLAMNDEWVWYPLMGRDESDRDTGLEAVVSAFCKGNGLPALTRAESEMLDELAAATEFGSDMDMLWATVFASRFGDLDAWTASAVREFMKEVFYGQYLAYDTTGRTPYELIALNLAVTEVANRLSPAAAVLAIELQQNPGSLDTALQAFSDKYGEWFGRDDTDGVFGAYCELWLPSLDDKVISKVGYGLSEACATGASMYIAGMEGWETWITHGWLGANKGTESLSGVYAADSGRSLVWGVYNSGNSKCLSGPVFGSGYGSAVNALVYRFGKGFMYTGESDSAFPFTTLGWLDTANLIVDAGRNQPDARFATGNPNLVGPITLEELQDDIAHSAVDWPRFVFPPVSTTPVIVPHLPGMTLEAAETALRDIGLMPGKVMYGLHPFIEAGYVSSILPAAGVSVVPGTAIDMSVSTGLLPEE